MKIISSKKMLILSALLMATSTASAQVVTTLSDFIGTLPNCNTLTTDTVEYAYSPATKITLSADPSPTGYCIIKIQKTPAAAAGSAAAPVDTSKIVTTTCPLSQDEVNQMTAPGSMDFLSSGDPITNKDLEAHLGPIFNCIKKATPTSAATATPPPSGAIPVGAPITLPKGTVAAPGTPTSVPAPMPAGVSQ